MSGTGKLLWSSDIFPGSTEAAPARRSAAPRAAPPASAAEIAYIRYALPVMRLVEKAAAGGIRRDDLAAGLADIMPRFDIDELQLTLGLLQQNRLLAIAERDPMRGNHRYVPSSPGPTIGAD